jgi:hypothetical protein
MSKCTCQLQGPGPTIDCSVHGMKYYTVVGYYTDNNQPLVEHVHSASPRQAAIKALAGKEALAVEVFKGKHKGCLANEEVLDIKDLKKGVIYHAEK